MHLIDVVARDGAAHRRGNENVNRQSQQFRVIDVPGARHGYHRARVFDVLQHLVDIQAGLAIDAAVHVRDRHNLGAEFANEPSRP